MISYPFAKINIGLNVTEKRRDGYHNVESIFYPINLFDIIEINPSSAFHFKSSGLPISGNIKNNLVVKAYDLIRSKYRIPEVAIHLRKQIPMGGGLGGGSSDAAFTLLMLNDLFNLKITEHELKKLALSLGSDCPFFIHQKPAFVTGIGDKVKTVELDLKGNFLMVVNSGIHIGTKMAYSGIKTQKSKYDLLAEIKSPINQWTGRIKNDFEPHITAAHPEILDLKDKLYSIGANYAAMTGSGSTVYGIFDKKPTPFNMFEFEAICRL